MTKNNSNKQNNQNSSKITNDIFKTNNINSTINTRNDNTIKNIKISDKSIKTTTLSFQEDKRRK